MRFHSNNTCLRSVQMEGADSFIESRPQPHVLSIPQLLWLPPSLSCSNGRKWTCGRSVNLHIRKTKCPTALAAPCAREVWIPHFHPMAFVPNAEHKCLVPCCRDPVGTEQRSCLVSHPRLGGPHLGGGLIYCRGNYPSPWERGRLSQPAPHLWRGSA